jgi:hypothetical protein
MSFSITPTTHQGNSPLHIKSKPSTPQRKQGSPFPPTNYFENGTGTVSPAKSRPSSPKPSPLFGGRRPSIITYGEEEPLNVDCFKEVKQWNTLVKLKTVTTLFLDKSKPEKRTFFARINYFDKKGKPKMVWARTFSNQFQTISGIPKGLENEDIAHIERFFELTELKVQKDSNGCFDLAIERSHLGGTTFYQLLKQKKNHELEDYIQKQFYKVTKAKFNVEVKDISESYNSPTTQRTIPNKKIIVTLTNYDKFITLMLSFLAGISIYPLENIYMKEFLEEDIKKQFVELLSSPEFNVNNLDHIFLAKKTAKKIEFNVAEDGSCVVVTVSDSFAKAFYIIGFCLKGSLGIYVHCKMLGII